MHPRGEIKHLHWEEGWKILSIQRWQCIFGNCNQVYLAVHIESHKKLQVIRLISTPPTTTLLPPSLASLFVQHIWSARRKWLLHFLLALSLSFIFESFRCAISASKCETKKHIYAFQSKLFFCNILLVEICILNHCVVFTLSWQAA